MLQYLIITEHYNTNWTLMQSNLTKGSFVSNATALEYGSCATVLLSRNDVTCVYMVASRRAAILSDTTVGGVLMVRAPQPPAKQRNDHC
jgi:hypothetical protein